jgi:hypothetical protein
MNRMIFRLLPWSRSRNGSRTHAGVLLVAVVAGALTLVTVHGTARAGSTERTGTSGANELRIPVGPRSTALGGTTVAEVSGPEAMYWNPAGLALLRGTEVYFSHLAYISDMDVNYFSIVTKAGNFGSIGFSAKMLNVGDVIVTTEAAPNGTGDILSPTFGTLGMTYARQFTDRVRFGATAQFVNETVAQARARGVAFDFGFQYETGFNGLTFGFAMKNFGTTMSFSGSDFEINVPIPDAEPSASNRTLGASSSSFEMPSYFQIGASYNLLQPGATNSNNALKVLTAFSSNNFTPDEFRGGAEYMYRDRFALRAGYNSRVSDTSGDIYNGFSWGAGLNLKLGGDSRLRFDYANRMVKQFFSDTNEFAVQLTF